MADREKAINGLECCLKTDSMVECQITECPYHECREACTEMLMKNVLSLLKAQEAKPPRFAVAYDKIFYACDNCGKSLLVVINAEGVKSFGNMPKYYPECGRAVKWNEPTKEEI